MKKNVFDDINSPFLVKCLVNDVSTTSRDPYGKRENGEFLANLDCYCTNFSFTR